MLEVFDLLIKNANIYTIDEKLNQARWLGIKDGEIAGLGEDDNIPEGAKKTIDVNNRTVLPGFINSHMHSLATGINESSFDLFNAESIDEVLEIVKEGCKNSYGFSLVYFEGLNVNRLREQREPSVEELDSVSGNVPIFLRYFTGHGIVLNSEAMKRADIKLEDMNIEEAFSRVQGIMSDDDIKKYMAKCGEVCAATGTTTINSIIGGELPGDRDCKYWISEELDRRILPVHVVNFYQSKNPDGIKELGLNRIGGCICLDGTPVELTAAFSEDYIDKPGNRGELYLSDAEIYKIVSRAHSLDMQCTFHAVGDMAIDQLLRIYNRVINEQGKKGLRHRIEHCDLPSKKHLEMAADLGIVVSVQPNILNMFGAFMVDSLGKERLDKMGVYPEIIEHGIVLAGGTDTPITPLNLLLSIHATVNNKAPHKRVSVTEAIKMFTINGAYAVHKEKETGSIEIGKTADLVVLDQDPYKIPEKIEEINVEMTIVEGEIVYRRQ